MKITDRRAEAVKIDRSDRKKNKHRGDVRRKEEQGNGEQGKILRLHVEINCRLGQLREEVRHFRGCHRQLPRCPKFICNLKQISPVM